MNIDDDQEQDHFFRINLVNRVESLNQMRRRIDMPPAFAHVYEQF